MTVVKKERLRTLSVYVTEAAWSTRGGTYDRELRERVGGHKVYYKPKVNVETQSDWVSLSVQEAEKLVKTLKKSIKKAKRSADKAAEGAK